MYLCNVKRKDKSEIGLLIGKDIKRLIKEVKGLKQSVILEYAESRKDVEKAVFGITIPLLQHWCLVRFCSITGRTNTKQHWKTEVFNFIFRIASAKVKPSNNREIVEKLVRKLWFDMEELNTDSSKVAAFIEKKFIEEKIDLSDDDLLFYAGEFQKSMEDIIYQMAYGDKNSITKYIDSI